MSSSKRTTNEIDDEDMVDGDPMCYDENTKLVTVTNENTNDAPKLCFVIDAATTRSEGLDSFLTGHTAIEAFQTGQYPAQDFIEQPKRARGKRYVSTMKLPFSKQI